MNASYPLKLSFKLLAFAPQVYVKDSTGAQILYVKQKLFKLKEAVNIYSNDSQSQQLYSINADRIIDFSAKYNFTDMQGSNLGAVKRQGMKSLWRATYQIMEDDTEFFTIQEENPWVKIGDAFLSEIPIVGIASAYLLNPAYLIKKSGTDQVVMKLKKMPSFWGKEFEITKEDPSLQDREEQIILLSILMMVLLERQRG
ncbi:MAG: hypothetical protein ABRQ38_30420 [Candidatus Eremiobacterota bacterium]